jgi:dTDP-6-deoxy-L-talose 4-dehydrogenase (NAD+)
VRVLVTGAGGFVGAHVARALVRGGDEVLALLRPGASRARIADVVAHLRVAEAALEDERAVEAALAALRPEAVVHLAWYARPTDYLSSPANLDSLWATLAFVRRALDAGCGKVVGLGTGLEYESSDRPRRESDPADPRSLYASCKLAAWAACRALARQRGAELVWARLFHVHGPGEDPARLVPSVAAALGAGRPFDLSPGLQVRDHLPVADVAAALAHLARPGLTGIFNVCSGVPVTLREVAEAVGEIVGRPELLRFGARPYAPDETMFLVGDPARLRASGWAPSAGSLKASLAEAIAAHARAAG